MKLPGGAGTLTFTGYKQWISLAITYDPGQLPALIAGIAALAGLLLSFLVRRRRVFVRAYAGEDRATVVDLGGLARSDAAGGFESEFAGLAAEFSGAQDGRRFVQVALPEDSGSPSVRGASNGDPARREASLRDPARREASLRDPARREASLRDPALRDEEGE
jgi:cytochrome c biogenesis protein